MRSKYGGSRQGHQSAPDQSRPYPCGMAPDTAELRSDNMDSRTATFERKRPHEQATREDNTNAESAESTPRKRKKHSQNIKHGLLRESTSNGDSLILDSANPEEPRNGKTESAHEASDTSTVLPLNWNAVNSIKVRTSFGGSRIFQERRPLALQVDGGSDDMKTGQNHNVQTGRTIDRADNVDTTEYLKPVTKTKPNGLREEATNLALAKLEELRERLASMNPHDDPASTYKAAQLEVGNAKVDYNYCLYYPLGLTFSPPPAPMGPIEDGNTPTIRGNKYQLWEQTKECMQEGTLQDLKEGRVNWGEGSSARASDLEQATKKLRSLVMGYADVATGGPLREPRKNEIQELHLDLDYCNYFPSNEEYLPLYRVKKGLEEPYNFSGGKGDLNRRAAQIWKLAQQCRADGTLQSLRDGRLEQCIINVPAATQSHRASELQLGQDASLMKSTSEDVAAEDVTTTNGPQREVELREAAGLQLAKAVSQLPDIKGNGEITLSQTNVVELSPELEEPSRVSRHSLSSDEDLVSNIHENERLHALEPEHYREVKQKDQELDEIDTNPAGMNERVVSDGSDSDTDSDSSSEDSYGLTDHEDSEHAADDMVGEPDLKTMPDIKAALTLADLNGHDLNVQLRYFHITKTMREVDRQTSVRCLVCSSEGHMAGVCDQLTCSVCGAFNHHTTQRCPSTARCSKCRELGHDEEHCLYKLKNMVQNEIVCDLCQRHGHIEEICELQWRTSGRPWEFNPELCSVRLSCYECGRPGHLGNDCPTRRPGKQLGSSSWGSGDTQISIKSKGEINIKGTARHDPIDVDDGYMEMVGAFIRPKVPEPVRKGKIHIKTGPRPTSNDLGPYSGWNPVNATYVKGSANGSSYSRYRDSGREDWQAASNRPGYSSYRHSNRRSRSPEYRNHDSYDYADKHQPPASRPTHQGSRSLPGADVYRPMPSSALNAWSRHRL